MRDPARAYRESIVRGASPVGLIVILYEEIIRSIVRARRALHENNIEQRTLALTHALHVIGHLQAVLNFEKGGKVARHLTLFYTVMQSKILEINIRPTVEALDWLVAEFSKVAEAWQEVDREVCGSSQEVSATVSNRSRGETASAPVARLGR